METILKCKLEFNSFGGGLRIYIYNKLLEDTEGGAERYTIGRALALQKVHIGYIHGIPYCSQTLP